MKKAIFLLILISFVSIASPSYAYWIWSPKSGKWANPKYVVKPTPQEQLKFAQIFLDKKDYPRALIEFQALIKNYPKAFEAAEGQFSIGTCLENMDKPYEAYLAYQKMIDKYPFSDKINESIQKEYDIADKFINGKKRKFAGVPLPVENPAIEILRKVIDDSTYGPLAPIAQYKLGLLFKALTRYQEAQEEFEKVIANYPESEWAEPAKFQIAVSLSKVSPTGKYDQGPSLEAKQRFEEFVRTHPDAELSEDALAEIDRITEKQAENNFNIARFYEKQHAWEAAKIYYNTVIKDFSRSKLAAQALERVKVVEKIIAEKNKKAKPLTKEEKQTVLEKKNQEKQERMEEIRTKKESQIREKKEVLENKKAEKQTKKETKTQAIKDKKQEKENARQETKEKKKSEAQIKKQEKLAAIEKKKAEEETKRKVKQEAIEKKKLEKKALQEEKSQTNKNVTSELEKQEKQKAKQESLEKNKAEKEANLKVKLEQAQKIKEEKEARRQAKIEAKKNKKTEKNIVIQQTLKTTEEVKTQEIQTQAILQETKNINLETSPIENVSEENPLGRAAQEKDSTTSQNSGAHSGAQIETRPESEGTQW